MINSSEFLPFEMLFCFMIVYDIIFVLIAPVSIVLCWIFEFMFISVSKISKFFFSSFECLNVPNFWCITPV